MEILKLGSIYYNNAAHKPGLLLVGSPNIDFGNTVPGKEISWVKNKYLYIAVCCVCTAISWNQLSEQGFIYGTPVEIDGRHYLCRSLKVGARKNEACEWNEILSELGDSNDLWHLKRQYCWGQEASPKDPEKRMVWGYNGNDRKRTSYHASVQIPAIGFRPVLEPLPPTLSNFDGLVGSRIRVYGPNGLMIPSILIGADDYDLTPRPLIPLPAKSDWAIRKGPIATVNRDVVRYVCEEEKISG